MKMPPPNQFTPPLNRFYRLVWDTTDVPEVQEFEDVAIITPQFDNLIIYGREVAAEPDEMAELRQLGRVMGEWFSVACPEGELGTHALGALTPISAEEFSSAYERGWKGDDSE